ncbi:hypothetical protein [Azonexus sp.]|uniref:hypothetical protein n=1 Tax=Azonexus sp. TaxID=1872668 RepID=UPI00282F66C7|nr:hypothetical protein [Azonexus sp.]MDR1996475.1 hypothetical protein [Azonexus sp.]
MQFKFNLFGFEIQVTRRVWYSISCHTLHDAHEPAEYFDTSMFLLPAIFQAWKRARLIAGMDGCSATYIVFRVEKGTRVKMVRCKTIIVHNVISFFGV